VRSCMLPVARASGKEIVTLEGLGTPEHPHPTDDQTSSAFEGLICRCGSHAQIATAVRLAARA
jgi:aerobic-type carbon monoxide dehydrogenase small subunit (CoxS/CutS family)